MNTTTRVYFRTVGNGDSNFADFRAPTLEDIRKIVADKLQEISNHPTMAPENKFYWTNLYGNLRFAKVTETVEIVA